MGLCNLVVDTKEIQVGGSEFTVRGLSLHEVAAVIKDLWDHLPGLGGLSGEEVILEVVHRFPATAAKLICLAADEPDMQDVAMKLPAGIQIQALKAIWDLSGMEGEEMGELLGALVTRLLSAETSLSEEPELASTGTN